MKEHRFVPTLRLVVLATFLVFLVGLLAPTIAIHSASHMTALGDLPQAVQSVVSATLGHDDAAYQFQETADGYRISNSSNSLRADFSNGGIRIESGDVQWMMTLQGIGYGDALETASQVAPTVSANRLEYLRGTFTEWYVNGPAGLEQGWTLESPPASRNGDALTLALSLDGNARVDASGRSVELMRDDGVTALRYTGLKAYDATGRELRAWMELRTGEVASSLRIRVDDTGVQYPLTIDPYVLQATLTNSGGVANDHLGDPVSITADGSTIVAGAYGVNSYTGAVYVFVKPGGGWATSSSPTATLTNSGGAASDNLGYSVSISADGSTIVAGAFGANGHKGAAYVFIKPGGGWATTSTPTATLTNSGGAMNDYFGASVFISSDGSTIVVGAGGVNSYRGAAYVFVKPGGGWATSGTPNATLTNSAGVASDYLGNSVASSSDGSTIVAGATGAQNSQGATYVFVKPGGGWVTTSTPITLTNSAGAMNDHLGGSVSVNSDGSTVVAGAYGVNSNTGAAYVFVKPGGGWVTTSTPITLTNSAGAMNDHLGGSVSVNSDGLNIVAGAYGVNGSEGAVYVFIKPGGGWATSDIPNATLTNSVGAYGDLLGHSVSISADGSTIVAGAYGVNSYKGAAYMFSHRWKICLPLIMR